MTVSGASSGSGSASTITTNGNSLSSSIDWNALITAAVNAKLAPETGIKANIQANSDKISAYTKLQTDLGKLATDLKALSKSIVNPLATNVFASRSATVSATGNVNASALLSMTIANGAATGDHTLQVSRLATAQKVVGTTQPSQSTALGLSGTFSIGLAGGSSASISITSGMTLQGIQDAINAHTSTTNVQASVLQVSDGSFELVLSGTQDAADITYSSTSGDDILNKLGVTDSSGAFSNVSQAAQTAEFNLDGVDLTRNTNDISDVLSGVTFSLLQPTPSGSTVNISIGADTDQISSAIQTMATDYNAFRDDVIAQQATNSDGTAASSAVLFGDSTMRDIMTRIEQVLGSSVGGLSMNDLGLSYNPNNNELQVDTGALSSILSTNLNGVMALLAAQTTTSSNQLTVLNVSDTPPSFTLDIQVDSSGTLTGASVNGDSSLFTVAGNTVVGKAGTIYAGMAFTYTGSTSQSITVTSTLGMAAQIQQIADAGSDTSSGSLQTQINSLTTQDTALTQKVNDIESAAATFQNQLKAQYAKYQAAIQSANNTMNYLSALLNAKSNN